MTLACGDDRRRVDARRAHRNGIDYVEVDDTQVRLTVVFLGKAPARLTRADFRVEGGARVRGIRVVAVRPCVAIDPDLDDQVFVYVDRPGDHSAYTLVVGPLDGFDPRCSRARFSFKQGCPADTDCAAEPDCPPPVHPVPALSYLAKDYAGFRQLMLDRLAVLTPDWTERHAADLMITLVELLAYAGDDLSYHQDAVAAEAYLDTARKRVSVRRHARLVDYLMHDGCNARAWVCVTVSAPVTLEGFVVSAGTEVFSPVTAPRALRPERNEMAIWTWGDRDCCLPVGTTGATLAGDDLGLAAGDVLILEEVRSPETGVAADADPAHRQAVRLLSVAEPATDPLYGRTVVDVTWGEDDALRFPLPVADRSGAALGVARGNVVLVEHRGPAVTVPVPADRRLTQHPITRRTPFPDPVEVGRAQAAVLDTIPGRAEERLAALAALDRTLEAGELAELTVLFGVGAIQDARLGDDQRAGLGRLQDRFERLLAGKIGRLATLARRARGGEPLEADLAWETAQSWGEPYGEGLDPADPALAGPAAGATRQDPRAALPDLTVTDGTGAVWTPARDLLAAGPDTYAVVGELDEDDRTGLRFGDGDSGARPAGELRAELRLGNGTAGNVGAGAIDAIVADGDPAGIVSVRNPLAAEGGTDPETVAAVRELAPGNARRRLLRAVTAADYARLAGDVPGVSRAAADLRWTGDGLQARVAVDPAGADTASPALLGRVRDRLYPYRRIGHDLAVVPATLVPIVVGVAVCVDDQHLAAHVRADLLRVLGPRGLFHPDRLTFGTPVRVSAVVAAAAAVPGVLTASVTTLRRLYGGPGADALDRGVLAFGPLEIPQLGDDPDRPDEGRLVLTIGGGR
ncbi:putative baseplate assembly protein [Actinoplanes sp. CA-030573]|uniref:putative baseplate assembly protein n=1 Tax=Actinoplanes sp. CA-030573 TaxID=3239898 RepID=UPI003D9049B3